MATQPEVMSGPGHADGSVTIKVTEEMLPFGVMPPTFDAQYVAGAVEPFLLSTELIGETPHLPMIDLALSKEKAVPSQLWGMLYEGWLPNPEEEGLTVFMQGYEHRGPNNERKRIYVSATTRDLVDTKYRGKIQGFYERLLVDANAGTPLMRHYFDNYYDLYWDLHVGATGDEIPNEVRQYSAGFNAVLGFWYPTSEEVRQAYQRTRETREALKAWLDGRVQTILDGRQPDADRTFVYYWLKNGELGEHFRRIDIVFECYHNFLAFSQWGNMIYNVAAKLEPAHGDPDVRTWFERTMQNGPDDPDANGFTPLDRLVMELFRVICPNGGSFSTVQRLRSLLGAGFSGILIPHPAANMSPLHWQYPAEFDPDRYKAVPTTLDNDEAKCREVGLARCPFARESFAFKDGRDGQIANSAFGAVYGVSGGKPQPLPDAAGYAPFGFGYRRCAGEYITVEFIKEFLRAVWKNAISFVRLDIENPDKVPVNPRTVLLDNIAFKKGA
jgi:hypothetical protein